MPGFNQQRPNFLTPQPSDKKLDFRTYSSLIKYARGASQQAPGHRQGELGHGPYYGRVVSKADNTFVCEEVRRDTSDESWSDANNREWDGTSLDYVKKANPNVDASVGETIVIYRTENTEGELQYMTYNMPEQIGFSDKYNATGQLILRAGSVFTGEGNNGSPIGDTDPWDMDTDRKFYVEISQAWGADSATVANTISTTTGAWPFDQTLTDPLVISYPLGEIINEDYKPYHYGDIWLLFPYTPSYHADIRPSTAANEVDLLGRKEHASVRSSGSGTSNFFEGRLFTQEDLGGGLRKQTDLSNTIEWGGVDEDKTRSVMSNYDDTEVHQINFDTTTLEASIKSGLVQEYDDSVVKANMITADENWLDIEAGGRFIHLLPGAVEWATLTINDGSVTDGVTTLTGTINVKVDQTGHIHEFNDGEDALTNPAFDVGYRYRHCSQGSTFADLIAASDLGDAIRVDDECYELKGTTNKAGTATADAVYTSCTDCAGSVVNKQIRFCSDDADAGIFDPGNYPGEFMWICRSSVEAKAYFDVNTAVAATNPANTVAPAHVTDCTDNWGTDLTAKDSFSGVSPDSGPAIDTDRWSVTANPASATVSGGQMKLDTANPVSGSVFALNNMGAVADTNDVVFEVYYDLVATHPDIGVMLLVGTGGNQVGINIRAGGGGAIDWFDGSFHTVTTGVYLTGTITITYTQSTGTISFDHSTYGNIHSLSYSGDIKNYLIIANKIGSNPVVYIDNVVLTVNGTAGQISIGDITGDAC